MVKRDLFTLPVLSSDGTVVATLSAMRKLVKQGSVNPKVRETAVGIVAGMPVSQHPLLIAQWVDQRTSFVRDPIGVEALHEPSLMIDMIEKTGVAGVDCDDVAILSAALGMSVGVPAGFVVLAFGTSSHYQHVFTVLGSRNGGYVAVDPTRNAQGFSAVVSRSGWFPL